MQQLNLRGILRVNRNRSHFLGLRQVPLVPLLLAYRGAQWGFTDHSRVQGPSPRICLASIRSRQLPQNFHNHYNPLNSIKQLLPRLLSSLRAAIIQRRSPALITIHPFFLHLLKPKQPRLFKVPKFPSTGELLLPAHGRLTILQRLTLR